MGWAKECEELSCSNKYFIHSFFALVRNTIVMLVFSIVVLKRLTHIFFPLPFSVHRCITIMFLAPTK